MPSYVRSRLLSAREFAISELASLKESDPAFHPAIIESLRAVVPFEHYGFSGVDLDGCKTGSGILLSTDMPMDMFTTYLSERYAKIDPILHALTPDQTDVSWFDLPDAVKQAQQIKPMQRLFDRYHIAPRTVFSFWNDQGGLYGSAGFTRQTPFTPDERAVLKWASRKLHDDMALPILRAFNAQVGLTDNEQKCLELASRGLTSEEAGLKTGLSTETVNTYFKSATRKLGARNRSQAIADAIRLRIID
ncbi:LuxR C-terminal-related transcriptional regulator [Asticcacaulis sp. BYS171W]|uniref:LuxR C-terminal-related transcriptional regulator n=1 Tax=Asticcacaulis aquaticus TaxID=2984212 RepID=A0ABT5HTC3_9CAUL|nr:LuxR family transcriptional regulator [Asticcacaulis aquaticus]MDC7683313.1 LuxR C-terminal-related transcriptional regulator [Asticcacaulis aquaticus]